VKGRYTGVVKPNAVMPSCGGSDQQEVLDVIATLRGETRRQCERLAEALGAHELCRVLHAIRRWYTGQSWACARVILAHRGALSKAMDLRPPVGAYRGFKVPRTSPLAQSTVGAKIVLPVKLNGGCSSWTLGRSLADRFSGSPQGKVGLVVRLASGEGVQTFVAPPERCAPWFNTLYARTMGTSHRHKEREVAIFAKRVHVEVVAVKR